MSQIQINNLNFRYPGQIEYIFKNVNLTLDTNWKIGLIGRNGSGKTTFLRLLLGKENSNNSISKNVEFEYFPYNVKNSKKMTIDIAYEIIPNLEEWRLFKELNLIKMNSEILYRNFETLSEGEKNKFLLICSFLKENKFLLIDEPTNHIDQDSRANLSAYLKNKKGFLLVSHDRNLLNNVADHILYIGKNKMELQHGNYDSWKFNKTKNDENEIEKNEKLKNEIDKLEKSAGQKSNWANQIEKSKKGAYDKGYIGHKSAKMMKKSKILENKKEQKIEEKSKLLIDVDIIPDLQMKPLISEKKNLINISDLSIFYDSKIVFKDISFDVNVGDRVCLVGKNGSGKSSILKLIIGEKIKSNNKINITNDLKISYVPQVTTEVCGNISDYAKKHNVDESIFRAMLQKLGVEKEKIDKDLSELSEGQKRKIMIARSISESAELYIWDEPLNYLDIQSREQLEKMILKYSPTMLFVEHDDMFVKKIATKIILLY